MFLCIWIILTEETCEKRERTFEHYDNTLSNLSDMGASFPLSCYTTMVIFVHSDQQSDTWENRHLIPRKWRFARFCQREKDHRFPSEFQLMMIKHIRSWGSLHLHRWEWTHSSITVPLAFERWRNWFHVHCTAQRHVDFSVETTPIEHSGRRNPSFVSVENGLYLLFDVSMRNHTEFCLEIMKTMPAETIRQMLFSLIEKLPKLK